MTPTLAGNFFRHEYGKVVSLLARRVGGHHLDEIEDAVQSALLAAVESWSWNGVPDNAAAWLYRVSHHQLINSLRGESRRAALTALGTSEHATASSEPAALLAGEFQDALLHMLFLCCDEGIPTESQIVLALKTLCGFEVREIAARLFISEAHVYKRLARARARLRDTYAASDLSSAQIAARLPTVQAILYSLFSEGYLSSGEEEAIRLELCAEALRLTALLAERHLCAPRTFALLALMHLNCARLAGREGPTGRLLLLAEQDRASWDRDEIQLGLSWLARAASGSEFSRYHAEAGIAAEHCLAPSMKETRWGCIVECYALLEREAPSPLHTLAHAVAVAELHGPEAGLVMLAKVEPPEWLAESYLWSAVLADLHRRTGRVALAHQHRAQALDRAPSEAVRVLLRGRLDG